MRCAIDEEDRVKIFVPDEELVWMAADVIAEEQPGVFEVEITDVDFQDKNQSGTRRVFNIKQFPFIESFPLQNEGISITGVEDMTTLNYLHEASILDNLRRRFHQFLPYTYTGEICIAINPYKWLNDLYSNELREQHVDHLRHELPPHVYATSSAAFRGLRDYDRNQSILVSGESGAGKTETVKILMKHIAHISGKKNDSTIEKVLQANPLLESFGNAKTARNDNSSRFGKFTQLQFDDQCLLVGSKCVTYLLEKSRVVNQNEQERNYHIFHQLFAAPAEVLASIHLDGFECADFNYTCNGDIDTTMIEGETDGARFLATMEALALLGVNEAKQRLICRIIAGILYLGQVSFLGDADHSSLDPECTESMSICCELLGLAESEFVDKTTTRKIEAEGQEMSVPLSINQANDGRDALAKDIYSRTFQWLVDVVNGSTAVATPTNVKHARIISLLDIFGFETFELNRFEQLCINFANEKLQQKFTQDVFLAVQQEYKNEGLQWESIGYKDNADVLELLEGKLGVIDLLNEECLIPKGHDMNFRAKLTNSCSKHPCFSIKVQNNKDEFTVKHFAGSVSYCVNGFVERNRDTLPSEIATLIRSSKNEILKLSYSDGTLDMDGVSSATTAGGSGGAGGGGGGRGSRRISGGGGGGKSHSHHTISRKQSFMKADTVTTKFRSQLDKLMVEISATNVQYVRCIKPNSLKSSKIYDREMVVTQLRCAGMIEAIRISRAAYPYRVTHHDFLVRFGKVRPRLLGQMRQMKPVEQCRLLLSDIWPDAASKGEKSKFSSGLSDKAYELGKTKVYFSSGVLEHLEEIRSGLMFSHIVTIQRVYRGAPLRKRFLRMRKAWTVLGAWARARIYRQSYLRKLVLVHKLQLYSRMKIARAFVHRLRQHRRSSQIQSWSRMMKYRRHYVKFRRAAVIVGAWMKTKILRRKFLIKMVKILRDRDLSVQLALMQERLDEEKAARDRLESDAAAIRAAEMAAVEEEYRLAVEKAQKEAEAAMEVARQVVESDKLRLETDKLQEIERLQNEQQAALALLHKENEELAEKLHVMEVAAQNKAEMESQTPTEWHVDPNAVILTPEMREQELAACEVMLSELTKIKTERDFLLESVANLTSQVETLTTEKALASDQLINSEAKVAQLEDKFESTKDALDQMTQEKESVEISHKDLEGSLATLQGDLEKILATKSNLESELSTNVQLLAELKENLSATEKGQSDVLEEKTREANSLREKLSAEVDEKQQLEALALRLKAELERAAESATKKDEEILKLESALTQFQENFGNHAADKEKLLNDQNRIEAYLKQVQAELVLTNEEKEKAVQDHQEAETMLAQAQELLIALASEKQQLISERDHMLHEKTQTESALLIIREELMAAEAEKKTLTEKNLDLKELERGVYGQLNSLRAENEQLTHESEQAKLLESQANSLREELDAVRSDKQNLIADVARLQEVEKSLKASIENYIANSKKSMRSPTNNITGRDFGDIRSGEIRVSSSASNTTTSQNSSTANGAGSEESLTALQLERDMLMAENTKSAKLLAQYKVEKQYMMVELHDWTSEVDELTLHNDELQRRHMVEEQMRLAQSQAVLDLLANRGVPPTILAAVKELTKESEIAIRSESDRWAEVTADYGSGVGELSEEALRRQRRRRNNSALDRDETDSVISSVSTHQENGQRQHLSQEIIKTHNYHNDNSTSVTHNTNGKKRSTANANTANARNNQVGTTPDKSKIEEQNIWRSVF